MTFFGERFSHPACARAEYRVCVEIVTGHEHKLSTALGGGRTTYNGTRAYIILITETSTSVRRSRRTYDGETGRRGNRSLRRRRRRPEPVSGAVGGIRTGRFSPRGPVRDLRTAKRHRYGRSDLDVRIRIVRYTVISRTSVDEIFRRLLCENADPLLSDTTNIRYETRKRVERTRSIGVAPPIFTEFFPNPFENYV